MKDLKHGQIFERLGEIRLGTIILIILIVLILLLHFLQIGHNVIFVLMASIFMFLGRKLGWMLSKKFLYTLPSTIALTLSILWGFVIATGMFILISWQSPILILRIIMGYALGSYVSIPNFGLLDETRLPEGGQLKKRDTLISFWSAISYILVMILLSLWSSIKT
ncbi:MAG: hypothetical protein U9P73_10520 [Candidatus Cloacimonadota bacterium]|nr:hypothetical protein [Candidatus Cloacimonadota bacterium]